MEQTIHTPETYDFRKYDQIWRRVAPNLEPYPDLQGTEAKLAELKNTQGPAVPAMEERPLVPHRGLPSRRPVRTWSTCPVRRRTPAAWAPWRRRNWE